VFFRVNERCQSSLATHIIYADELKNGSFFAQWPERDCKQHASEDFMTKRKTAQQRTLRAIARNGGLVIALLGAGVLALACEDDETNTTNNAPATNVPTNNVPATPGTPTTTQGSTLTGSAGPTDQETNMSVHPVGDIDVGREVFRFETFGNEGFWTNVAQLPQGIKAAGVTPLQALALGISVDIEKVPAAMIPVVAAELKTDLSPANAPALNSAATTEALIEANAIVGISARNVTTLNGKLDINTTDVYAGESVGVSCAFCHSITDGSIYKPAMGMRGGTIGKRLDGPTNHDLEFGKALAAAKNSRAYYPTLALNLVANEGKSLSRKGPGVGLISAAATEVEVDAYLSDPELYPIGTFDDAPDGNGAPMHTAPFFRTDLAAPWGSEGSIKMLHNFGNLVYTALFDPTDLTTEGGKKFLRERGGEAGLEIVTNYEAILAEIGVEKGGQNGYPFVGRATRLVNGVSTSTGVTIDLAAGAKVEDSPIGMRVDEPKNFALNGYLNSLKPPPGDKSDPASMAAGRNVFREQCTSCHRDDQSRFVPQNISPYNASVELFANASPRPDLWPGYVGEFLADRTASGLVPVRNSSGTFDDKLVVIEASNQDQPRGSAMPLLMDLARKPVFLHDDSVKSLDELLNPAARTVSTAPHPFFIVDAAQRAQVVTFLKSLDDEPLP